MGATSPLRRAGGVFRRALGSVNGSVLEAVVWCAARQAPRATSPPRPPRSIFVLRNNDVGDVLLTTPLLAALRRRFPQARLAVGVGPWSVPVLAHNPNVDVVLPVAAPWFNGYGPRAGPLGRLTYLLTSQQVARVRHERFELGIDVLGSGWGSLLLLRARIPHRLGVRGYAGGHSAAHATVRFDPGDHVARAALRFAELLGTSELPEPRPQLFLTAEERRRAEELWDRPPGARILVAPGGGVVARCWPQDRYARLIASLASAAGWRVAVVGGPKERGLLDALGVVASGALLLPELPLREVFALAAGADLVVCNSSMLLHAAAAFARPTLVTLGPAFGSARQHDAQWGYPGTSLSLGHEPGERPRVCEPDEVLARVRERLLGARTGATA